MKLYHYWRSSSSWRVRWALDHHGVPAELIHVNLLSGESESPAHLARNPLGYVPVLELGDGRILTESIAILEWLDESTPRRAPLLPPYRQSDPVAAFARARLRQLVQVINSDTQPLQNLTASLEHSPDPVEQKRWNRFWNERGLAAFETLIGPSAGRFSVGDHLSLADICLIPQCYAALRNEVDLDRYPNIARIYRECLKLPSCASSHPDRYQPPA